jgi:hypothetical protein
MPESVRVVRAAGSPDAAHVVRTTAVQVVRPAGNGAVVVTRLGPPGPAGAGGIDRPTAQGIALVQALIFGS